MSNEKKSEVTEEIKETRKLTEEELEQVNGGGAPFQHVIAPALGEQVECSFA